MDRRTSWLVLESVLLLPKLGKKLRETGSSSSSEVSPEIKAVQIQGTPRIPIINGLIMISLGRSSLDRQLRSEGITTTSLGIYLKIKQDEFVACKRDYRGGG